MLTEAKYTAFLTRNSKNHYQAYFIAVVQFLSLKLNLKIFHFHFYDIWISHRETIYNDFRISLLVFMIQYIIWQAELIITIINKAAHKMLPHFMPSHFAHTQIFLFSRLKLLGNMIEHVYYCFSLTCQKLTNWTSFCSFIFLFIGRKLAFFSSVSMSYYLFACLLTFYDEWSITQKAFY